MTKKITLYTACVTALIIILSCSGWLRLLHFSVSEVHALEALSANELSEESAADAEDATLAANGPGTYQDTSAQVKYKGAWQKEVSGGDGTYATSNTTNSTVRLKFTGTDTVSLDLRKSKNAGKIKVIIRQIGGAVVVSETVDLYKLNNAFETITYKDLNPSLVYRVRVVVTGGKNTASASTNVGFDKFVLAKNTITFITPTEDPEEDGITEQEEISEDEELDVLEAGIAVLTVNGTQPTTLQENDPRIAYKGTWSAGTDGTTTFKKSNVKKNNSRVTFKGKSVQVILRKSPDAGKVRVVLRNITKKTNIRKRISLYSPTVGYTTNEIVFNNLIQGDTYRVRVVVPNKKVTSSTGTFIGIDKFIFTAATFPTPSGGSNPTVTGGPTPTGVTGKNAINIPIGSKASLSITIGSGGVDPSITPDPNASPTPTGVEPTINPNLVNIRFKTKVYGNDANPDIDVRMKVVHLQDAAAPGAVLGSCQEPGTGEVFLEGVTLSAASDGTYSPKVGTSFSVVRKSVAVQNGTVAAGGWIPLSEMADGKNYSISVKGPKHVNNKMADNVVLHKGSPTEQNFDWSSNPLIAGDVPDPESEDKQNCVVNAADVSLVKNRIIGSSRTAEDLAIADLDYNGVLNSSDMGQLTHTLSIRPDDE